MIAYIVLFIIAMTLARATDKAKEKKTRTLLHILLVVVLTCFVGFRYNVGTDYASYYREYFVNSQLNPSELLAMSDPGMKLIAWLAKHIYDSPITMFFLISLMINVLFIRVINKYAINYTLSICLWIITGTYLDTCNAVRQAIAMAFIFTTYRSLLDRKMVKYCILILIATFFHSTAIIMLPIYFILTRKPTKGLVFTMFVISFALSFSTNYLFGLSESITGKMIYVEYSYFTDSVNIFRIVVAVTPCLLLLFADLQKSNTNETISNLNINLIILNAALMIAASQSAYLARIGIYSTSFLCLSIPQLLNRSRLARGNQRIVISVMGVLYFAYWLFGIYASAGLFPYQSVFNL